MAEFYHPDSLEKTGKDFTPLNKNMESLFLSKIETFIKNNLDFIKDNHDFFHYETENYKYKVCYVSKKGNFCIIYITIFTENSLYYYEINKKTGDSLACIEFLKFFENKIIPQDVSEVTEESYVNINMMLISQFSDVKKQALLSLYHLVKHNSEKLIEHTNLYTDLFECEDDWENTFCLINILKIINADKEITKKQIEKCLKKLKDISISSNIRKTIVENAINNFIDEKLKNYKYDADFLETVEKERIKVKNINDTSNFLYFINELNPSA